MCGDSPESALEFIRRYETNVGFDRGYYAGPFGYIGHDSADVVVAIRSALVTNYHRNVGSSMQQFIPDIESTRMDGARDSPESKVSVFGGAGIVDGSTVQVSVCVSFYLCLGRTVESKLRE